jgi:hypothetical protein
VPHISEYLYSFPAYTEDAYCSLSGTAVAECLVTAAGGALAVPTFTNRRTLSGEMFQDGFRAAIVTKVMPTRYGAGPGEETGERGARRSTVSPLVQTRDGGRREGGTEMGGSGMVGGARTVKAPMPRMTGTVDVGVPPRLSATMTMSGKAEITEAAEFKLISL